MKLAIRLTPDTDGVREHHWAAEETVWGHPLGDDLFEIRNIPWETEALHFLDVVRCRPRSAGIWEVVELVRSSGHSTLRLTFADAASDDQRRALLDQLNALVGEVEHISDGHWASDVNPSGDLPAALEALAEAERAGVVARSAHA